jgi:FkbM family methyltransferase
MILIRIEVGLRRIYKLFKYIQKFGLLIGTSLFLNLAFIKRDSKISLPGIKFPITIRYKTTDLYTLEEIFLYEKYNISQYIQPTFIIDGGAYSGLSTIYFANKFPEAKIIAIEPETLNFQMLGKNTYYYPNIELIQSAIWHEKAWLTIKDLGLGEYGFMVEETAAEEQGSFRGITIDEILINSGYRTIDILKLNVEGSEREIFSGDYEKWLGMVKVLIIQLHDDMKPGCSAAFYTAINNYNFRVISTGLYNILISNYDDDIFYQ